MSCPEAQVFIMHAMWYRYDVHAGGAVEGGKAILLLAAQAQAGRV